MKRKLLVSLSIIFSILLISMSFTFIDMDADLKKISSEYETYHLYDKNEHYRDSMAILTKKWQEDFKHYNDSMRKVTGDTTAFYYRPVVTNIIVYSDVWTPVIADCVSHYRPPSGEDDTLQFSHAPSHASPHGDKLYRLFIKDYNSYYNKLNPQPLGQVLVKEVWKVKEVVGLDTPGYTLTVAYDPKVKYKEPEVERYHYQKVVKKGDKFYTPKEKIELFIMYKTQPTEENDAGWVYGTMDISQGINKGVIIQKGVINQCVKCHAETKYDRIFGP